MDEINKSCNVKIVIGQQTEISCKLNLTSVTKHEQAFTEDRSLVSGTTLAPKGKAVNKKGRSLPHKDHLTEFSHTRLKKSTQRNPGWRRSFSQQSTYDNHTANVLLWSLGKTTANRTLVNRQLGSTTSKAACKAQP